MNLQAVTMLRSWESADKSVRKNVLKPGVFGKKPNERSKCNVTIKHTSFTLHDDNTGDEKNLKRKDCSDILQVDGERDLIIGDASGEVDWKIERALQTMNAYEKSRVTIVVQQGAFKDTIVTFEITLNKCERHKPIWEWSAKEKYHVALRYKATGIELFNRSRIVDAFHKFSRACKILITMEPIPDPDLQLEERLESDIKTLRLALYSNMAICQLTRKNYEHTVSLCSKVLDRDPNNVKALYRRGMAYGNLKDNEKAVRDLKIALALEPNNCSVKEQFNIYNSKLQESIQRSNDMVRRMFKA